MQLCKQERVFTFFQDYFEQKHLHVRLNLEPRVKTVTRVRSKLTEEVTTVYGTTC